MNQSVYWITLDVHRSVSQAEVNVMKGDNARTLKFVLTDGDKPYPIADGCTAVFRAEKPDGTVLYNACTVSENVISYVLTNQTTASVGVVGCEVQLTDGNGHSLTSPRFTMLVSDTLYDDGEVESEDEFTALQTAIANTNNLNVSVSKSGSTATITVTKKDGTTSTATVSDGSAADVSSKLTEPSSGLCVGKYFRIASLDANGHPVLECVDGTGGGIEGAKPKDGSSGAFSNVGNYIIVPTSNGYDVNGGRLGLVFTTSAPASCGIDIRDGAVSLAPLSEAQISLSEYRTGKVCAVPVNRLDYAVGAALGDGLGTDWSEVWKQGAWKRLSVRKSTLDNVLVLNGQYDLGAVPQSSLTLTLPTSSLESSAEIYVAFRSGATATSVNIVGDYYGDVSYLPSANSIVEMSFKYICGAWVLLVEETAVA